MRTICKILLILFLFLPRLSYAISQQTSGVTAQTIIDQVKDSYLNEGSSTTVWTDAELLNHLNHSIMEIVALTKCLETTEEISLVTGTTEYAISSNYIDVKRAVYSGVTSQYRPSAYKVINRIPITEVGTMGNPGEPARWYLWNDYFYVEPEPSTTVSGHVIVLYELERPTALSLTGTIPTPAVYDYLLILSVAIKAMKKFPVDQARGEVLKGEYGALLKNYNTMQNQ